MNVEFVLSVAVFLLIVSVLSYNILSSLPGFHSESVKDITRSKAYQVSEILLKDEGEPSDWNTKPIGNIKRIGLSGGQPFILNEDKITELYDLCTDNYEEVLGLFGLEKNTLIINITDLDGNSVLGGGKEICKPKIISETAPKFWIYRFGILGSEIVKVRVLVY